MSNSAATSSSPKSSLRRDKRRLLVDHIARWGVGIGGISVIVAITLIFFYLAMVVAPLFKPAHITQTHEYAMPGSGHTTYLAMEEQGEIALRINQHGDLLFFSSKDGSVITSKDLDLQAEISAIGLADPASGIFMLGLDDGTAMAVKVVYKATYPEGKRVLTPALEFPLGEEPVEISDSGEAIKALTLQTSDVGITLVAMTESDLVKMVSFVAEDSLFEDEISFEQFGSEFQLDHPASRLLMNKEQRILYIADEDGTVHLYDIADKEEEPSLL